MSPFGPVASGDTTERKKAAGTGTAAIGDRRSHKPFHIAEHVGLTQVAKRHEHRHEPNANMRRATNPGATGSSIVRIADQKREYAHSSKHDDAERSKECRPRGGLGTPHLILESLCQQTLDWVIPSFLAVVSADDGPPR
jgi:hypothetical protein